MGEFEALKAAEEAATAELEAAEADYLFHSHEISESRGDMFEHEAKRKEAEQRIAQAKSAQLDARRQQRQLLAEQARQKAIEASKNQGPEKKPDARPELKPGPGTTP